MYMRLKLSLKSTWTLLVLFIVIVPVSALVVWFGRQLYTVQLNSALSTERMTNELIANQIELEVKRLKTLLKNKSDPLGILLDRIDSYGADHDSMMEIEDLLSFIVSREEVIHEVIMLSGKADVISAIDSTIYPLGDRVLSSEELQSMAAHWGLDKKYEHPEILIPIMGRDYIGAPNKHKNFYDFIIATSIGDPAKAVLIAKINVKDLWAEHMSIKNDIEAGNKSKYVLDSRGVLLTEIDGAYQRPGDLMTHLGITRAALINSEWSMTTSYIGVTDQLVYGAVSHIPSLNWALVSEVNTSTITGPIRKSLLEIISLTITLLLAFIWFALYLAGKTLRPIQHTCEAIEHVAKGDYNFVLEPSLIRELDDMTDGFRIMAKARQTAEIQLRKFSKELEQIIEWRTKDLKNAQEKLVRSEKLAAVGQLASSIGHELRNPMGIIGNSAYYLGMRLKDGDEKVMKHLAILQKEVQRSNAIITDLLDFSKASAPTVEEVDLKAAIRDALATIELSGNVVLETRLDEGLPTVLADASQVRQIFQNLIVNASQAMPEGGGLKIEAAQKEDYVEIRIEDTGEGISEENLGNIFEPLFTTKTTGIGLGLAIVKGIIERHRGVIEVASEAGEGTTFTVKLPIRGGKESK